MRFTELLGTVKFTESLNLENCQPLFCQFFFQFVCVCACVCVVCVYVCVRACVCYCIRNTGFGDTQRRKTRSRQSASPRDRLRRREADAGPGRPLPFRRRVDGSAESGSASGGCVYIISRALATCGEAGTTPLSLPARTPEVREVRVGVISRGTRKASGRWRPGATRPRPAGQGSRLPRTDVGSGLAPAPNSCASRCRFRSRRIPFPTVE